MTTISSERCAFTATDPVDSEKHYFSGRKPGSSSFNNSRTLESEPFTEEIQRMTTTDFSTDGQDTMSQHGLCRRIHSCVFCSAQEMQPLMPDFLSTISYRGSRVSEGASRGCEFFQAILTQLFTESEAKSHHQLRLDRCLYELKFIDGFPALHGGWKNTVEGVSYTEMNFGICTFSDNSASDHVLERPIFHDFAAPTNLSRAISLLEDCNESHPKCQRILPSSMPKRILRLSKDEREDEIQLRLELISHPTLASGLERYSALTYCWGGDQKVKLNAASISALQRGIAASELPQTLHDAASDDPADLAQEIANLPAVFGNAYVTISASRAKHRGEGFLRPVSFPLVGSTSYKLPYACRDGRLGSVLLYEFGERKLNPVNDRAWTFQEYMLSRRILAYRAKGLRWTCRTRNPAPGADEHELLFTSLHSGVRDYKTWMGLVEAYSARKLTNPEDKLPAISGLAEIWETPSDSYVAGLWLSHLPLGLLWLSTQPFKQTIGQQYRAPSWSWACQNGSIGWYEHMLSPVDPQFDIISCTALPSYSNAPYGAVLSGTLTVRGHLKQSRWVARPSSDSDSDDDYLDLKNADNSEDYGRDAIDDIASSSAPYCLQICMFDENLQQGPLGLILTKDNKGYYHRVGIFHFRSQVESYELEPREDTGITQLVWDRYSASVATSEQFEDSALETITII